jgi:hypothetical protein
MEVKMLCADISSTETEKSNYASVKTGILLIRVYGFQRRLQLCQ